MKTLRLPLILSLAALAAAGCILTSAQILAHYELPNPFIIDSSASQTERIDVDLNTVSEYTDNKDKLKGLSDVAIVGRFTNQSTTPGGVEVWITPGATSFTTKSQVTSGATLLWGPATIGASGTSTAVHDVGWDESAQLFNAAGKKILIDEGLGDGQFTLYTIGTAGVYKIKVDTGSLILTISAGI